MCRGVPCSENAEVNKKNAGLALLGLRDQRGAWKSTILGMEGRCTGCSRTAYGLAWRGVGGPCHWLTLGGKALGQEGVG